MGERANQRPTPRPELFPRVSFVLGGLVREVLLSGLAEVECNKAEPDDGAQDDVGPHQDEKANDDDDRFQSTQVLLCVFHWLRYFPSSCGGATDDRQGDPRNPLVGADPSKRQLRLMQLAQGEAAPAGGVGLLK